MIWDKKNVAVSGCLKGVSPNLRNWTRTNILGRGNDQMTLQFHAFSRWDFVGLMLRGNSTLYWHNGETARNCYKESLPFPLVFFFFF